jgi:hypothetical protein
MNHAYSVQHAPAPGLAYQPFDNGLPVAPRGPALPGASTEELRFSKLHTPAEIARVMHLRRELRLPGAGLADAAFASLEKKETSWGL